MDAIWRQAQGDVRARLAVIEETLAALAEQRAGVGHHRSAAEAAHKLSGSCASFGYVEASEAAGQLERLFAADIDQAGVATGRELLDNLRRHLGT